MSKIKLNQRPIVKQVTSNFYRFKGLYWEEKVRIKDCKSLIQRLQTCSPWGSCIPPVLMIGNFDEVHL